MENALSVTVNIKCAFVFLVGKQNIAIFRLFDIEKTLNIFVFPFQGTINFFGINLICIYSFINKSSSQNCYIYLKSCILLKSPMESRKCFFSLFPKVKNQNNNELFLPLC